MIFAPQQDVAPSCHAQDGGLWKRQRVVEVIGAPHTHPPSSRPVPNPRTQDVTKCVRRGARNFAAVFPACLQTLHGRAHGTVCHSQSVVASFDCPEVTMCTSKSSPKRNPEVATNIERASSRAWRRPQTGIAPRGIPIDSGNGLSDQLLDSDSAAFHGGERGHCVTIWDRFCSLWALWAASRSLEQSVCVSRCPSGYRVQRLWICRGLRMC